MSHPTRKLAAVAVGLLVAAGPASAALADTRGIANGVQAPKMAIPDLSRFADGAFPILGSDKKDGDLKCALIAFSLGPLYFLGPFGSLGPWGPMGPLHGDPEHPCFGGLDKKK